MATPTYNTSPRTAVTGKGFMDGYVFGAPMTDFGWFAATFVGIFSILFYNAAGHKADFANSYRLVGLPVGATVMVLALSYLGMLWVRRITRKS